MPARRGPAIDRSVKAKRPFIIGIAGGTNSGKTTVVKNLSKLLGQKQVVQLSHDDYYRNQDHLTFEERTKTNYDHPNSLETSLLVEHLQALMGGQAIQRPVYNFVTCTRLPETVEVKPTRVVIVEGMLALQYEKLRSLFDLKVFVDTDADLRLMRKIQRDMTERGRSFEWIARQYLEQSRPMHTQFVEPSKYYADVIIPQGGDNHMAIDLLHTKIIDILERG
jgi:uridine kinase